MLVKLVLYFVTRRPAKAAVQPQMYHGSSDCISEEDNLSESTTDNRYSSLTTSTDNLQLELTSNMSDGLSDKEMVVKRMKHQVASPEHMKVSLYVFCNFL